MIYLFASLLLMYLGRKVGWAISKKVLYPAHAAIVLPLCVGWGAIVALLILALIRWQEPHIMLKIIMGYALGWYVAIPNFGLMDERTIPPWERQRHLHVSTLPSITYLLTIAMSFVA